MKTSPSELAPRRIEYQFNCNKAANPIANCTPSHPIAPFTLTAPLASGRVLVLSTKASYLRSHRSFTVHPAPRMTIAPVRKRRVWETRTEGGSEAEVQARAMDQEQGRKSRREPRGACRRERWMYGWRRERRVGFAGGRELVVVHLREGMRREVEGVGRRRR